MRQGPEALKHQAAPLCFALLRTASHPSYPFRRRSATKRYMIQPWSCSWCLDSSDNADVKAWAGCEGETSPPCAGRPSASTRSAGGAADAAAGSAGSSWTNYTTGHTKVSARKAGSDLVSSSPVRRLSFQCLASCNHRKALNQSPSQNPAWRAVWTKPRRTRKARSERPAGAGRLADL